MKRLIFVAALSILFILSACNKTQASLQQDQSISSSSELLEVQASNDPLQDISDSQPVSSSSTNAAMEGNEDVEDISSKEPVDSQVVEPPSSLDAPDAKRPDSITLTRTSATSNFGEETFWDEENIEIICKIIYDSKPLEDTKYKVRSGGTIITAELRQENTEQSLTMLPGLPNSLGIEVMVIQNGSEYFYTDISCYQQLTDMIG